MITHNSPLPSGLDSHDLARWISQNGKERYTEDKDIQYTQEEMEEMKNRFIQNGIEIQKLKAKKKELTDLLTNGSTDEVIEIPSTKGLKSLEKHQEDLSQKIDKGYYKIHFDVYGIPNEYTETMDFYDTKGELCEKRVRKLTTAEKQKYFGMLFRSIQKAN